MAVKKKGSMQRGKIQVRKNQQFRNTEPGCVYSASQQVGYQKLWFLCCCCCFKRIYFAIKIPNNKLIRPTYTPEIFLNYEFKAFSRHQFKAHLGKANKKVYMIC